jgi:hypothetical protein
MATQQYGYGPNVWSPAKGIGVQQFAKLAQPGAVAPQFKAENKYKALAAKAIGEMAYGAMMNDNAKKEEAKKEAELKAFAKKNTEMNYQRGQTFDSGFSPSIVGDNVSTKDEIKTETNTQTKTSNGLSDMSSMPKGDSFIEKDSRGISGTWNYIDETKPLRMTTPAWQNKIAGGYTPTGKWTWSENKYTGKVNDYKVGDRIVKSGQVYQAIEGLNGQTTWTPVY